MTVKGTSRRCRQWPSVAAFLLLTLLVPLAAAITSAHAAGPEDVIVIFRDGLDATQRDAILTAAGAVPSRHFQRVSAAAAQLPDAAVRAALEQHPDVTAIVPDRQVQAHAKPDKPGGGGTTGQVVPAGVQRIGAAPGTLAWTGSAIGVAVVDTGLDFAHQDLQVGATCFTAFTACQDDNSHGTHVGGIIAALNNTIDVVGVAPNATLYAVKVLDAAGNGTDSTVIAGLDWIAQQAGTLAPPVRVVNMSLGRAGSVDDNPALRQAVQVLSTRGIAVVVSAGNDPGLEVSQQVPATYPEVMAVASTSALDGTNKCRFFTGVITADTASWFTTDGAFDPATGIGVTASAPGEDKEDIAKSCFVQSVGILSTRLGGGTTRLSGTSMSAPHVAGVVTLLWEKYVALGASLTPEEARSILRSTADRLDAAPLNSPTTGYTFDGEREGVVWAPGALQ
ncbi:MAG: S8 family serine peptidase [Candidatus Rokubacteria bacterium]|nr:S8 family serine peptidase [Candidatus Rokubacteria bacterium]